MPDRPTGVTDTAPAAGVTDIDVVERPSATLTTVTTADPGTASSGSSGTLAVTANARMTGSKIRVIGSSGIAEIMYVTAGAGTSSLTVTRGQDGTTGVAHSIGATVSQMVGVQRVEPVDGTRIVSYKGRVSTFRTPGRAGTAGQKMFAIHNATGSTITVDIEKMTVDCLQTAAAGIAPTVIPPIIRPIRFTAVPTNGTALTKVPEDTALTSNSAVTVWGDASADGTGSATTLTVTLTAGASNALTQEYAPRVLVVGTSASTFYEPFDRTTFFEDESVAITLRPLEGVCLYLDYAIAAGNPTTTFWITHCRWTEYRTV
jgi:hypothetical protein